MSDRARRKEKHRIKRQQKRAVMRRAAAISPYKRLAQGTEIEACYINDNWRETGIAAIRMIGQGPGGGLVFAAFLIDLWCIGLKDAFGRLNVYRDEIEEHIKRGPGNVTIVRIDPDKAGKLVAGAIRFSRQNGFRLPRNYDRWTAMFGDLGDVASADISDFGKDGGLRFVGEFDDLKGRLIGCSVEDFLAKPDVQYVAGIGSYQRTDIEEEDDDDDDEFESAVTTTMDELSELTEICVNTLMKFAQESGEAPIPYLAAVTRIIFLAAMIENLESADTVHKSDEERVWNAVILEAAHTLLMEHFMPIKNIDPILHERAGIKMIEIFRARENELLEAFKPCGEVRIATNAIHS